MEFSDDTWCCSVTRKYNVEMFVVLLSKNKHKT